MLFEAAGGYDVHELEPSAKLARASRLLDKKDWGKICYLREMIRTLIQSCAILSVAIDKRAHYMCCAPRS